MGVLDCKVGEPVALLLKGTHGRSKPSNFRLVTRDKGGCHSGSYCRSEGEGTKFCHNEVSRKLRTATAELYFNDGQSLILLCFICILLIINGWLRPDLDQRTGPAPSCLFHKLLMCSFTFQ